MTAKYCTPCELITETTTMGYKYWGYKDLRGYGVIFIVGRSSGKGPYWLDGRTNDIIERTSWKRKFSTIEDPTNEVQAILAKCGYKIIDRKFLAMK